MSDSVAGDSSTRNTVSELLNLLQTKQTSLRSPIVSASAYGRHPRGLPLIPGQLRTEREGSIYREQYLWRLNDPKSSPAVAAERLARELNLPQQYEQVIEGSINAALRTFKNPPIQIPGDPRGANVSAELLTALEVRAEAAGLEFADSVEWDLMDPLSTPEGYALTVCRDLSLGEEMYRAIVKAVKAQIRARLQEYADSRTRGTPFHTVQHAKRVRPPDAAEAAFPVVGRKGELAERHLQLAELRESAKRPRKGAGTSASASPGETAQIDGAAAGGAALAEPEEGEAAVGGGEQAKEGSEPLRPADLGSGEEADGVGDESAGDRGDEHLAGAAEDDSENLCGAWDDGGTRASPAGSSDLLGGGTSPSQTQAQDPATDHTDGSALERASSGSRDAGDDESPSGDRASGPSGPSGADGSLFGEQTTEADSRQGEGGTCGASEQDEGPGCVPPGRMAATSDGAGSHGQDGAEGSELE
mmetsp:Transcript_11921/g.28296  ORF Transcript_11921/g.28296 Transcript_11921/m.28296 type:complete len:474 (-) Transcript_11921:257-1678(-)